MGHDKKPLIVVLSGTYGVGKTTLAHQLGIDLQIMQRATLSAITKTIKTILPNDPIVKNWYKYDQKDSKSVREKLQREAKFIGKIISTIVINAESTGENYIIDGVQLLPEFLLMDKIVFFYINVPEIILEERFNRPKITRLCHLTHTSYTLAKKVDKLIQAECAGYQIFKIDNSGSPEETSKKMIQMIKDANPDYLDKYLWYEK